MRVGNQQVGGGGMTQRKTSNQFPYVIIQRCAEFILEIRIGTMTCHGFSLLSAVLRCVLEIQQHCGKKHMAAISSDK